jgi:hypothetical protein
MSARRGTTQYNNGCRAFVEFFVSNCTAADGKIYCLCKYCQNNQCHSPDYVLTHLTGGRGMKRFRRAVMTICYSRKTTRT